MEIDPGKSWRIWEGKFWGTTAGIKSGKIKKYASASTAIKKTFPAKKEASAVYSQKSQGRIERRPTVGAVMIQNSSNDQPRSNQPRSNQQRVERPQWQFTRINMTSAQVIPHLLKLNLTSLKEAPKNPNTSSPYYHSIAKCAYHSDSAGHDTNNCWALKNKIQDLIDAKEVEFDAPEKPNVIYAPMPKCDRWIWNWLFNAGSRNVAEARVTTVFYFLQMEKTKAHKNSLKRLLSVREVDYRKGRC